MTAPRSTSRPRIDPGFDWSRIAYTVLASRRMDETEETRLVPEGKVLYQFTARGHDVPQVILGTLLDNRADCVSAYYRSRPLLLSLGLGFEDAFAAPMGRSGGFSDGRDIGVVCNMPPGPGPAVLPMAGEVGSQYTPAAGWAQAIEYRAGRLDDEAYSNAIAVAHGGDGSVATNGFWSALTIATTLGLPVLFYIEDNGYGISVPGRFQTPGGNIAENLSSFRGLTVLDGDGSDIGSSARMIADAVATVRERRGPVLLRLTVPRLSGHSGQDTQTYKDAELLGRERERDPLTRLHRYLVPGALSEEQWSELEQRAESQVAAACEAALARAEPDPGLITRYVFSESGDDGAADPQQLGGLAAERLSMPRGSSEPSPEPPRVNMVTAIRRTLDHELSINPRLVVFGEDVGPKGGVHAATLGLQQKYGDDRVFDTSLSEEGIIGRAVGMALAGLVPVAEIQFRKYADPATEQLHNCGTIRWRTANRMAAPIVVRMPGGFFKCGDPWHSVSNEAQFVHAVGWRVAIPSNAQDAVGLLRAAMRGNDPVIFFEHRNMLDAPSARRPYPGDEFVVPFGEAARLLEGDELTVVTWGGLVDRCRQAAESSGRSIDLLDLRTVSPWDKRAVLESLSRTKRCLIVHEDGITAGFGAEIAAVVVRESFFDLDAPVERLAVPDVPVPYNVTLMNAVVPTVERIADRMRQVLEF
jgi:2-oxoisovalerate dehydrogenase E1 component